MLSFCKKITALAFIALGMPWWAAAQDYNITQPSISGPDNFLINAYNGNLHYARTDLVLPGRGPDLEIAFYYNSARRDLDWGMGKGWTASFTVAYAEDSLGIVIERADGRNDLYTEEGGDYLSPTGVFDRLEEYETDKLRLVQRDGTTWFFDDASHKKLTRVEDRNGNTLQLAYAGGLVQSIADAAGRVAAFTWENGHLVAISSQTDPPRTISYAYNAQGSLERATNPEGGYVEYQYDPFGRMTGFIDENGNIVTIDYNGQSAVKRLNSCLSALYMTYDYTNLKSHVSERVGKNTQVTTYAFDGQGRLISQKGNCCGYAQTFEYDGSDNLVKRVDANGNPTLYSFDNRGNVIQQIDALGNTWLYEYEPAFNNLVKQTDPKGNQTIYEYDAKGNRTAVHRPLGVSESMTYNAFGEMTAYTDANNHTSGYVYDNYGYAVQKTNALGASCTFSYDEVGNRTDSTDWKGNPASFAYDGLNRLVSATDALGHTETFAYDNRRNLIEYTDKNQLKTTSAYDAFDRLIERTDPLGHKESFLFDARNLVRYTDQNGHDIKNEYDNLNRLVSIVSAVGEEIKFSYDGHGNLQTMILPNGNEIVAGYDAVHRLIELKDGLGLIGGFGYDANSNITALSDGNGGLATQAFDALNRRVSTTDPLGKTTQYAYDNKGNLLEMTDRNGNTTAYAYDALDRWVSTTDALANVSAFGYDANGNLTSITDPNSHTTTYGFDALDRLVSLTYDDGSATTYIRDASGQVVSRQDNNGQQTAYTYDDAYRLTKRSYSGGGEDNFTYDPAGNIVLAQNAHATVALAYDAANRLVQETLNGKTTSITYDLAASLRTVLYPGGKEVREDYDPRGRLSEVGDGQDIAAYLYDLNNQPLSRTYANGTSSVYSYDANARLLEAAHFLKNHTARYAYTYDQEGFRTSEGQDHQPESSRAFSYDALNRLTSVNTGLLSNGQVPNPLAQTGYELDPLGNRISLDENGAQTNYASNNLNQYTALSGGLNALLSYDLNGNLLADGVHAYGYDPENRLVTVDDGAAAVYQYDPFGRRIASITGADTIRYYFDGRREIEERGNGELLLATYVYGRGLDEVLVMDRGGDRYFYFADGLGSVTQLADAAGELAETYQYDAFGAVRLFDAAGSPLSASLAGNPWFFTGRRLDVESGLYYYRARHYSSSLGRFLQRDPLGYVDGLSLYEYALGNPVNFVDPLGTCAPAAVPFLFNPAFWSGLGAAMVPVLEWAGIAGVGLYWASKAQQNGDGNAENPDQPQAPAQPKPEYKTDPNNPFAKEPYKTPKTPKNPNNPNPGPEPRPPGSGLDTKNYPEGFYPFN